MYTASINIYWPYISKEHIHGMFTGEVRMEGEDW